MKKAGIAVTQIIVFVFTFSFIISCSFNKSVDQGYYFQDFDNLRMWDHSSQVTDEFAHSGKYCTYTDTAHEFSQVFEMDLASPLSRRYKSIQITAWCMKLNRDSKVKLIATIENQGKELIRESADFSRALEIPRTWINLVLILKFPENVPDDSKIKIYCWSPEKENSFMDDVQIEFRKK